MIDAHRIHTQEEDMEQDFIEARVSYELRAAISDALDTLGEDEARAIIEHELQFKRRTH